MTISASYQENNSAVFGRRNLIKPQISHDTQTHHQNNCVQAEAILIGTDATKLNETFSITPLINNWI